MDESPIFSRTPRRSRYSLYQSDYETAGEESDSSLYYSTHEDEDKENESGINEKSTTPVNTVRRSLLGKCLQKNFNHTPRNEFNKRVSFNVNPFLPATTASIRECEDEDDTKPRPSNTENDARMFDFGTSATNDATAYVASDEIEVTDRDQSLNSTIVANCGYLPGSEVKPEAESEAEQDVETITIDDVNEVTGALAISIAAATSTSVTNFDAITAQVPKGTSPFFF